MVPSAPQKADANPHWKAFLRRQRDPHNKRQAILKTAAQLFLETSYRRTSLNDVAARLNVTKPTLYHYFQNKEEILLGCYRSGTGLIEDRLNKIAVQDGTGLEKVEAFIYAYASAMTMNFGRCVMRVEEGDLSRKARAEVRASKRKIDRRLQSFLREGVQDGSIAVCNPKIAAFAIDGALNWISMWYEPQGTLSAEEIGAQFARTLTQGLANRRQHKRSGQKGEPFSKRIISGEGCLAAHQKP